MVCSTMHSMYMVYDAYVLVPVLNVCIPLIVNFPCTILIGQNNLA
jgi:hypothetical protein